MEQLKSFLSQTAELFLEQRDRFILWVPVFIGIGVGLYFSLPHEPALWVSGTGVIVLLVSMSMLRRFPLPFYAVFCLLLPVLGFTSAKFHTDRITAPMLEKRIGPTEVSGICQDVKQLPENKGWRVVLSDVDIEKLSPEQTPARVRVQIYKKAVTDHIRPGMRVSVLAILNAPSSPVMPGAFDFRRHMFFERIGGTGYAIGPVRILDDASESASTHHLFWEAKRQAVREKITASFPERTITGSLLAALLAGERDAITEEVWEDIRTAGLAHLLAISGLHIGLVSGFLFFSIRALLALSEKLTLRYNIKKWSALFALLGTILYLLLVGAPISAQRATIMTGIVLVAVMLDREGLTMRLAAVAATVILLFMPQALLNAGFHMSFAAVVCLIAAYEAISERWKEWYRRATVIHRGALYLFSSMFTTVVASIATAPFSLFHFHRVADEMSLLANLIAVPLTAFVVMPAGLLALVLMPFGLQHIPLQVMGFGVEMIYDIAHDLTQSGDHMIHVPAWSMASLLLMIFGGLWLSLWSNKLRLIGIPILAVSCVMAWMSVQKAEPDIYLSDKGELLAVRADDGAFLLSSKRKEKFVSEQWQLHAGWLGDKYAWYEDEAEKSLACDWMQCRFQRYGQTVVFVKNPIAFVRVCEGEDIDLLIAAQDNVPWRCSVGRKINRYDVWDRGAHVIYLEQNKIHVKTVAEQIGVRPWVSQRFIKNDSKQNEKY